MLFFGVLNIAKPCTMPKGRTFYPLAAGFFNGIGLWTLYVALTQLHPATVGLVNRTGIVFAMILAFAFMNTRPAKSEIILGAIAIMGAFGAAGFKIVGPDSRYLWFSFLSTLGFTCSQFCLKKATSKKSNFFILLQMNVWSGLTVLVLFLLSKESLHLPSTAISWSVLIAASLIGSCLGIWFYLISLKNLSFPMATILRATGPVFTKNMRWWCSPYYRQNLSLNCRVYL